MAYDYYTVWALAVELREALLGRAISAANTRGEVLFIQSESCALLAECRREGTLRLLGGERKQAPVAQGEGAERYLAGARIIDVCVSGRDRVIHIRLERENQRGDRSYGALFFELLNNRVACALTSDRTGEILGAWGGQERIRAGQVYEAPRGSNRFLPGVDAESAFIENVSRLDLAKLGETCRRLLVGLDRQQMEEVFYRSGLEPEMECNRANLRAIWGAGESMFQEAQERVGYAYFLKSRWHFSGVLPQRLFQGEPIEKAASISAAVSYTTRENGQAERARRQREGLNQLLRRELKSSRKKLTAMRADLKEAEKAAEWERKGHIILAQIDAIPIACEEIELQDVFDPAGIGTCLVKLNPQLTAAENAANFLKKAQKLQRREKLLPQRIEREELFEKELAERESRLVNSRDEEAREIEEWLENRGIKGKKSGGMPPRNGKRQDGPNAHPRQYITRDGWTVLAGRNNKENDILTHKMAAQNDIWFHAHGYPGSHVILRRDGRKEEPSKQSIEDAAGVAAFWSKGKSAKKVSVVYTLAKYVSKPKGGAPGQAIMKREKTIIVEPNVLSTLKNNT